ncbi:hypothetical protein GCM10010967_54650 [Dyadobacter beijingensis]|uniref:Outer membrane protein beta-barrel domain-containing protein n=1 Tax=Dyadobacter beijingensis TaxID=365489 RepID=A0ABQ2IJ03_9BACT|nr:porin family protein [Dyadobacter beijingensis]GGN11745.1 hypothetical protein GCM10010967_54650 [Dyadobacter beijingensis]
MKRLSCSVILIFLLQNIAFAQSADSFRRWRFGVLVGPQFSTYAPNRGSKWVKGWMAGTDISYAFQDSNKGLSLHAQPAYNHVRTKTRSEASNGLEFQEYMSRTSSIQLPVLARYTFLDGKIRPFAEAGLQGNYLVSWYIKYAGRFCADGGCYPYESSGKVNSDKKTSFGALASAGVEIDAGKVTIPIAVRLVEQIKKREDVYDISTRESYRIPRTRTIQVSVGVVF